MSESDGPTYAHRIRIDRTRARAWVLQIHYKWESSGFDGNLIDALRDTTATRIISQTRLPYIKKLVTLLENHLEEIDAHISSALENWHLDRVSSIDRGILRIGAVEICHLEEVPPKVSIQEAILLAEAYGGSDSPRFVNGVLDAVFKDQSKDQAIPQNLTG